MKRGRKFWLHDGKRRFHSWFSARARSGKGSVGGGDSNGGVWRTVCKHFAKKACYASALVVFLRVVCEEDEENSGSWLLLRGVAGWQQAKQRLPEQLVCYKNWIRSGKAAMCCGYVVHWCRCGRVGIVSRQRRATRLDPVPPPVVKGEQSAGKNEERWQPRHCCVKFKKIARPTATNWIRVRSVLNLLWIKCLLILFYWNKWVWPYEG